MPSNTTYYNLWMFDPSLDTGQTFLTFRSYMAGTASNTNMYLIDTALHTHDTQITALQTVKGTIYVALTYQSANYFTATGVSGILSYTDGTVIDASLNQDCTGTVTININSLGTKSLLKYNTTGSGTINLNAGDMKANRDYLFRYSASAGAFIWISPTSGDQNNAVWGSQSISGASTLTAGTMPIVLTDTTSAAFTITLPASPSTGEWFRFIDNTSQWGTHNLTINPNGKNIDGSSSNITFSTNNGEKELYYNGTQWNLVFNMATDINNAVVNSTPNGASKIGFWDNVANALRSMTLTNLVTWLGTTIAAATKTTPVFADSIIIGDSAASNALKSVTLQNLFANLMLMPDGTLVNGKISPSVTSNNLTLALVAENTGSVATSTNPIFIKLGGAIHSITAALSVTVNAGTNSFNAGGAELATKEIDYFSYLGYNATDGVVIGFSRIPFANIYSDFSATTTNEKYCAISTITNAAAGDNYVNIGRFAATLSAGAGYTWTVPTYTAVNLVQRPVYETRKLLWVPQFSASGSMTYGSVTTPYNNYWINGNLIKLAFACTGTIGGTPSNVLYFTLPLSGLSMSNPQAIAPIMVSDSPYVGFIDMDSTLSRARIVLPGFANWGAGVSKGAIYGCVAEIPLA